MQLNKKILVLNLAALKIHHIKYANFYIYKIEITCKLKCNKIKITLNY